MPNFLYGESHNTLDFRIKKTIDHMDNVVESTRSYTRKKPTLGQPQEMYEYYYELGKLEGYTNAYGHAKAILLHGETK